jgi:starch synthase
MNILMLAAEMSPLVKVGGLGDVTGALPAALARRGHHVRVVLPLYGHLDRARFTPSPLTRGGLPVRVGQRMVSMAFFDWPEAPEGVDVHLVACDELYGRPGVYADDDGEVFADTIERAALLAQAALMLPELADWPVDVVHAHDVQAALAPVYRRRWYVGRDLPGAGGTLLTIHNLAHQEVHAVGALPRTGLPEDLAAFPGILEYHGRLNLLKAGISDSDRVNTVSPTYAREVVSDPVFGCGLEGVLGIRGDRFDGILNGVDYDVWNPSTDPHLAAAYDGDDLAGKAVCRPALADEVGLTVTDGPILGLVGRLVHQKGVDIVAGAVGGLVAAGCSLVVLGTGDARYHDALTAAAAAHPGRVVFLPEFSEPRAHRIYAGSDAFLMPSRFEPCGLGQLYALRYGAVPLVRRTGGLADTVVSIDAPDGTGIVFDGETPDDLLAAVDEFVRLFADRRELAAVRRRGMAADFSWDTAAAAYEGHYRLLAAVGGAGGEA